MAALLQAFTEPVLNRVAVKRMTLGAAIREVRLIDILRFFRTVLATMPGAKKGQQFLGYLRCLRWF